MLGVATQFLSPPLQTGIDYMHVHEIGRKEGKEGKSRKGSVSTKCPSSYSA